MLRVLMALVLLLALAVPVAAQDKFGLCHATSSETNPFVFIEVPEPALKAHFKHGDFLAADESECETPAPTPEPVDEEPVGGELAPPVVATPVAPISLPDTAMSQ